MKPFDERAIPEAARWDYSANGRTLHDALYQALLQVNLAQKTVEACAPNFDDMRQDVNDCRLLLIANIKRLQGRTG